MRAINIELKRKGKKETCCSKSNLFDTKKGFNNYQEKFCVEMEFFAKVKKKYEGWRAVSFILETLRLPFTANAANPKNFLCNY